MLGQVKRVLKVSTHTYDMYLLFFLIHYHP